ncbi:MAG: hypothetical protein COB15_04585 [Flavobacteriales bacterium]|nr:MAG: hypothetical protein COB15_04585 [Flavobacteriales bacterium]
MQHPLKNIIRKGSIIVFGIQVLILIIPFIIELITGATAVLSFAIFFYFYFLFFTFIWVLFLLIMTYSFFKHKAKTIVYYPFLLSLLGLLLPIILTFWVVSHMH